MTSDPASGLLPSTVRALDHLVATRQSEFRVPSLAVGIYRGTQQLYGTGVGTLDGTAGGPAADVHAQYRVGSITKTFVGAAVLKLVDEHQVALADRIAEHLPELSGITVTVAELLSQSAGLTAEPDGSWWERSPGVSWSELAGTVTAGSLSLEAGAYFHYSNLSFAILGRLIETKRGVGWFDAVRGDFLEPLGMSRTSFMPQASAAEGFAVHPWADLLHPEPGHDGGAMAPAGQIWSTVADLAIWAHFLTGDGAGLLSPESVAAMHKIRSVDDGDSWTSGYGLGLQILRHDGRRLWGHSGSMPGFVAGLWNDESQGLAAIFLCNSTSGPGPGFSTALLDIVASAEPSTPPVWVAAAPAEPGLTDLVGLWFWGPASLGLTLIGPDTLELKALAGTGRGARFRKDAGGRWIGDSGYYFGEELTAVRNPDGSVNHLNLNTFILTRTAYDPAAPIPGGLDERGWHAP